MTTANNETEEKQTAKTAEEDVTKLRARTISKLFKAHSQKEGAGFIVHRPIGGSNMNEKESDPFLMLDELGPVVYKVGEFPGAPWHPHRGFDTVMYMKKGEGCHQDSMGNKGVLKEGDVQWMTAGSGIIHDEGKEHPGGLLHGFQMWVNLPKKHKMCDPQYQQITNKNFPFLSIATGVACKAIVGKIRYFDKANEQWQVHQSPIKPIVAINYFDYAIEKDTEYQHVIDNDMRAKFKTAIMYVYNGQGQILSSGNKWVPVQRTHTIKFGAQGDYIKFKSAKDETFGFLLLLGEPIQEPIAWRGPFVMNTAEEIQKCISDYQQGKLATVKGKSFIY
eukprot:CAMPEP_0202698610 /NCGR_PEP_ID=MMETSP1385-20130828/11876_1 /ASSEMBLY_ACC=CAM_ASM_000861 /TAXON_ID=933848 /ORGANISM="Elphidium margaritaceum" /LENGTH=333 /DNA_ID=CAMNT_0049355363 /DNA_START=96 /DNA_END=1097 /DNA_ORIENTATION=-